MKENYKLGTAAFIYDKKRILLLLSGNAADKIFETVLKNIIRFSATIKSGKYSNISFCFS